MFLLKIKEIFLKSIITIIFLPKYLFVFFLTESLKKMDKQAEKDKCFFVLRLKIDRKDVYFRKNW